MVQDASGREGSLVLPPWGCSQPRAGQPGWEGGRERRWHVTHKERSIWGRGSNFWVKIYLLTTNIAASMEHWKTIFSRALQQGVQPGEAKSNRNLMPQSGSQVPFSKLRLLEDGVLLETSAYGLHGHFRKCCANCSASRNPYPLIMWLDHSLFRAFCGKRGRSPYFESVHFLVILIENDFALQE